MATSAPREQLCPVLSLLGNTSRIQLIEVALLISKIKQVVGLNVCFCVCVGLGGGDDLGEDQ
jgi:hypothetical protein